MKILNVDLTEHGSLSELTDNFNGFNAETGGKSQLFSSKKLAIKYLISKEDRELRVFYWKSFSGHGGICFILYEALFD